MEPKELLKFMHLAEKLKDATRHCYTSGGRHESVADHSWRMTLMAFLVRDEFPDADMDKVIRMCLIHDLGEAFTGDIPSFLKTDKDSRKEDEILFEWVKTLPEPYKTEMKDLYEEMIRLEKQENELVNRYYAELAASRFSWNGQDYTLDELYQADRDGTLEGIDFGEALTQFYTDVNRTLGGIFVQLVQVRQALAAEAGYDNYLDMAYDDNYRDYDPGQAAEFTQAVRLELVPLYRQAKEIGLTEDAFMGTPEMDPDDALMLVTGIADAMGDDIDETAEFLLEYDLINVDRSDVKASDSYEIYLPDYESPYIFANTIGYAEDILTIAHELGHAVDDYVHYEANDSTDVSETLSQAMEYLSLPYLEDDVRETVTAYKLMDTLSMYAEQGCYNAFEEEVYALAPENVTLENINAIALRSAEAFGTTSEWGTAYDSMSWVDITHFFQQPMYIISYIVSDSMAIQFYEQEVAREGRGLELYKKAMGLAGEKAFTELAPALDLRDPLSAAQVHAIANLLRTQLFK